MGHHKMVNDMSGYWGRKAFLVLSLVLSLLSMPVAYACGSLGDPCQGNWEMFEYGNDAADLSAVPPDQLDIQRVMNVGRGKELTPDQIAANFDKIDDLSKMNEESARQAIRDKYGANVEKFAKDVYLSARVKDGVLIANGALGQWVTLASGAYKGGTLIVTREGHIMFTASGESGKGVPSWGDKSGLMLGKDSFVLSKTPGGDGSLPQLHDAFGKVTLLQGNLEIRQGEVYLTKGESLLVEGVLMSSQYPTKLLLPGQSCIQECVKMTESLEAKGKDITLTFREGTTYMDVSLLEGYFFRMRIGNGMKEGSIILPPQVRSMPPMQQRGWVEIENGGNFVTFDDKEVRQKPTGDKAYGSVPLSVAPANYHARIGIGEVPIKVEAVYSFDNNQGVYVNHLSLYNKIMERREDLYQQGWEPKGYFSQRELETFADRITEMSEKFNIDYKKMTYASKAANAPSTLSLEEADRRLSEDEVKAFVYVSSPYRVLWKPNQFYRNGEAEVSAKIMELDVADPIPPSWRANEKDFLSHEFGHVVSGLGGRTERQSTPLEEAFVKTLKSLGGSVIEERIQNPDLERGYHTNNRIARAPNYLFPTGGAVAPFYSKTNTAEMVAEYTRFMSSNDGWFRGEDLPATTAPAQKNKIVNERGLFRTLISTEMGKYRKETAQASR